MPLSELDEEDPVDSPDELEDSLLLSPLVDDDEAVFAARLSVL